MLSGENVRVRTRCRCDETKSHDLRQVAAPDQFPQPDHFSGDRGRARSTGMFPVLRSAVSGCLCAALRPRSSVCKKNVGEEDPARSEASPVRSGSRGCFRCKPLLPIPGTRSPLLICPARAGAGYLHRSTPAYTGPHTSCTCYIRVCIKGLFEFNSSAHDYLPPRGAEKVEQ